MWTLWLILCVNAAFQHQKIQWKPFSKPSVDCLSMWRAPATWELVLYFNELHDLNKVLTTFLLDNEEGEWLWIVNLILGFKHVASCDICSVSSNLASFAPLGKMFWSDRATTYRHIPLWMLRIWALYSYDHILWSIRSVTSAVPTASGSAALSDRYESYGYSNRTGQQLIVVID